MSDDSFFTDMIEKGQFRVDDTGHVSILNEFVFIIPSPVVAKQYALLEERLGTDEAAELMHEVGEYQVQQAAERYVEKYNFDTMQKERIQEFTQRMMKLNGFGDISFSEFDRDNGSATVVLPDGSVFASRYRQLQGETDHPVDHWLMGILERHFSVIFDVEVTVEESDCIAQGDDMCRFCISVRD